MATTLTHVGNGTNKPVTKGKQAGKRAVGKHDLELGKRIRLRRVEIGISQDELGQSLGVSFQQIQKYEKGINRVSTGRITEIAKALDVPISFFYSDKDNKEREVESLLFIDSSFSLRLLRAWPPPCRIWVTKEFRVMREGDGVLFRLGEPEQVLWFAEGRKATRAEVLHSIETGLPLLMEVAEQEGPEAVAALNRYIERAQRWLPA